MDSEGGKEKEGGGVAEQPALRTTFVCDTHDVGEGEEGRRWE